MFSYFFCLVLIFNHINVIFLLETFPFLSILLSKQFIFTQVNQVFNLIWFCSFFWSSIFVFPLVSYHLKCFFSSSWYKYQLKFYINLVNFFVLLFLSFYFVTHFILIPKLLFFLLQWDVINKNSLVLVEAEISLFFYVIWSTNLKLLFSFVFSFFILILWIIFHFLSINSLYELIRTHKKLILFKILCLCFFLIPPDFTFQLFLTVILYLKMELLLLIICIKLYNSHQKRILKDKCQL